MNDEQTAALVLDIYKTMQRIYMAPKPRYVFDIATLSPKMEERIEAAGVALSCLAWLENYHARTKS